MPDTVSSPSAATPQAQHRTEGRSITLRMPKLSTQTVILGLVAFITLFQTIQLFRISAKAASAPTKAAPAATTTSTGTSSSGSSTDVPQDMVGGC